MRCVFLLAAAVSVAFGSVAWAGEPASPSKMMRALQGLEDRIVTGDTLAQTAHGKAVLRLGQAFAAMPPETWREPRNARALVAYLFSGANGDMIAQAIPAAAVHKDAASLYRGALAYAGGDDDAARTVLMPIDPKTLPPGLAGRVALVQAALAEPTDKPKALASLDLARLLEPGTLVEEAALRKELALMGDGGDFDKLAILERRYQAAFAHSVYAGSFNQLVGSLAVKEAAANSSVGNERSGRLLAALGRESRKRYYLAVAREEAVAGHLVSAPFAALQAASLADKGGRDAARADLYYGASALVGSTYEKALAALVAAPPEQLDERDRTLRVAALDMAATIHAAAGAETTPPVAGENATLQRGEQALDAGRMLLRGGRK